MNTEALFARTSRSQANGGRPIHRVLLISLPAVLRMDDDYLVDGHPFHLGLAYIAALLRKNGVAVGILDCYAEDRHHVRSQTPDGWLELGLSDQSILDRIRQFAPECE